MRTIICIFLGLNIYSLLGQNVGNYKTFIDVINEARTQPQAFLKKYQEDLKGSKLAPILKTMKPIEKIAWDEGLYQMCLQEVNGKLSPAYKGKNKVCGYSGGKGSGDELIPIEVVESYYTNVIDPDYAYFGMCTQKDKYVIYWGSKCEKTKYTFTFNEAIDSSKVVFSNLRTADKETYLTAEEKEMIKEINFVRAYPKVYAKIIAKSVSEEKDLAKKTLDAANELIAELDTMKPRSILKPSRCVYDAAKKHGLDCQKRGAMDHMGSDGSWPWDRLKKTCNVEDGNENLAGTSQGVRAAVIDLLLDDGISSRGHRYNMLNPQWNQVGCFAYVKEKNQWYTMKTYVQNFIK